MAVLRSFDSGSRYVLRNVLIVLGVVFAVYLVYLLRRPISGLVIAAFLAVALSAPIRLLSKRMPRGGAIALVYTLVVLIPVGLGALLIPPLVNQAEDLVNDVPGYASDVETFVNENSTLQKLNDDYSITSKLSDEAGKLPSKLGDAGKTLRDIGVGLLDRLFAAVTILILSIFMVSSGGKWIDRLVEAQRPGNRERLRRTLDNISSAVAGYVGGALIQATLAGTFAFIMLSILGAPFAGALALVIAFGDLIPVVGATLAAALVSIVLIFVNFPVALIVWVIFAIIYQQIENYVIQPQIQGRAVQVEAILILIAVLFGSTLFGVLGALLAIPAAATLQITWKEFVEYRREVMAARTSGPSDSAAGGIATA
ncbi:AI-2E family transporter [soil metagenome]